MKITLDEAKTLGISVSLRSVPLAISLRSDSRASSMKVFATALDSMENTSSNVDCDEADEKPTTQRMPTPQAYVRKYRHIQSGYRS